MLKKLLKTIGDMSITIRGGYAALVIGILFYMCCKFLVELIQSFRLLFINKLPADQYPTLAIYAIVALLLIYIIATTKRTDEKD